MGRPSNTPQRRAEIVQGLLEVMAAEGYERATINAIARAAGLSPGLVHYHFENKEEILVALVDRLVATVEARYLRRIEDAGDDARRQLDAFIDAYLARGDDEAPEAVAAWVVVGGEAITRPAVRSVYGAAVARSTERLREILQRCLEESGRDGEQAAAVAAAVMSAIEGTFLLASAAPDVLPEGFAAPTLRRLLAGLLDYP